MSGVDIARLCDVLGTSEEEAGKLTVNELHAVAQERGVLVSELFADVD